LEPVDERAAHRWCVGVERPHLSAGGGVACAELAVAGAEVDAAAVVEERGRVDDLAGEQPPAQAAIGGERVEGTVSRSDVDVAVAVDHRRAEDALAGGEAPQMAARLGGTDGAPAVLDGGAPELRPRAARVERDVVVEGRGARDVPEAPLARARVDRDRSAEPVARGRRDSHLQLHASLETRTGGPIRADR